MKYLLIVGIVYLFYRFSGGKKALGTPTQEEEEEAEFEELD